MPAMADITVKKNDGTTDFVYVAKSPSAGDSVPAVWRGDAATASYAGLKPEIRMVSKWNGARTVRRVELTGVYPSVVTDTTTGAQSALGRVIIEVNVAAPQMLPQGDIDEAVSQILYLASTTLAKSCFKTGFAPT